MLCTFVHSFEPASCTGVAFLFVLLYKVFMDNAFANALKQRNLTPKSASERTGIPLPTVQKHFYGTRNIGAQSLAKYHDDLGIPLSELRPDLWRSGDSEDAEDED